MRRTLAFLLLAPLLAGCASTPPEPVLSFAFLAEHAASEAIDGGFRELFKVTRVDTRVPQPVLTFELDYAPVNVTWTDPDENLVVTEGDSFSFVTEVMDRSRHIEAKVRTRHAWSTDFKPGTGPLAMP